MKKPQFLQVQLDTIIGGGQALGTLDTGKKLLAWGGLPKETVTVQVTKKKSKFAEGIVTDIIHQSPERIQPRDPDSYLSTSPWQIMTFASEQHYKAALIEEAFELHNIVLPEKIAVYSNEHLFEYRNKIEYSFWYDTDTNKLDLAFFMRGSHGKVPIKHTSLAMPSITQMSQKILSALNSLSIGGKDLKTLLIRSSQTGQIAWQLYVKDPDFPADKLLGTLQQESFLCGEVIYSDPRSPASVVTKRLAASSDRILSDTLLGVPFHYATEGFFQVNIPVYEQTLRDIREWVDQEKPVVDLYSGVGSIGLTVSKGSVTLVESNESAVKEMRRNIVDLKKEGQAAAIQATSEDALEHITSDGTIIVDPPRAGLHDDVIATLLAKKPERIIYVSCNPVTQARDVAKLSSAYGIRAHKGYNFFPRTPHIEHLVVLDMLQ